LSPHLKRCSGCAKSDFVKSRLSSCLRPRPTSSVWFATRDWALAVSWPKRFWSSRFLRHTPLPHDWFRPKGVLHPNEEEVRETHAHHCHPLRRSRRTRGG